MASSNPPWLKRVLIPLWIIQLLAMAVLIAGIGIALDLDGASLPMYVHPSFKKRRSAPFSDEQTRLTRTFHRYDFVILIFCAICLILTVTEIVLFARSRLHSITYLSMQAVKTGVWAIVFVLVLVSPSSSQNSIGDPSRGVDIALGGLIQALVTL